MAHPGRHGDHLGPVDGRDGWRSWARGLIPVTPRCELAAELRALVRGGHGVGDLPCRPSHRNGTESLACVRPVEPCPVCLLGGGRRTPRRRDNPRSPEAGTSTGSASTSSRSNWCSMRRSPSLVMIPVAFGPTTHAKTVLSNGVLRWLGAVSYGLFLWHPFVLEAIYEITDRDLCTGGFVEVYLWTTGVSLVLRGRQLLPGRKPLLRWGSRARRPAAAAPVADRADDGEPQHAYG